MSRLVQRTVKGNLYYYLEESSGSGKKRVRESFYIGSKKPSNAELLIGFKEFKSILSKKGIETVVPPLTEFIAHVTALKIDKAVRNKKSFIGKLNAKQKEDFIKREKITFITDSNAIEGSTLNYKQTEGVLLEEKKTKKHNYLLTGSIKEQEEAVGLSKCLDLYEKMLANREELSEEMILKWHYILLNKIQGYTQYAGIWRPVNVYIVGSAHKFPHYSDVPRLMKEMIAWYGENKGLIHPVEMAAVMHTKFTSIHSFADGNGRIARLLMNYILQLNGMPFTNIPLRKRSRYMDTQAAGNTADFKPFTKFLSEEIINKNNKLKKLK